MNWAAEDGSAGHHFGFDARVLICQQCGAPLRVALEGGATQCTYCKAVHELTPRARLSEFRPPDATQLAEPTRLQNLRAQVGQKTPTPSSLTQVIDDGEVPAWRVQEAFAIWQSLRSRAAEGDLAAAEDLLILALVLARQMNGPDDILRQRALLESTLETMRLPRHRQILLGALCRGAAREGDLAGAQRWLDHCDPRSADLAADTAYRLGRALVAAMRGQHAETLAVLGRGDELRPLPLATNLRVTVALLRANALAFTTKAQVAAGMLFKASWKSDRIGQEALRYRALQIDEKLVPCLRLLERRAVQIYTVGSFVALIIAVLVIVWRSPHVRRLGPGDWNEDGMFVVFGVVGGVAVFVLTIKGILSLLRGTY